MKKKIIKKSAKATKWNDADDAPALTKGFLKKAVAMPPISDPAWAQKMDELTKGKKMAKKSTLSIDNDVVNWFKTHSENCQASVNHVLRHYILSHELPR